MKYIFVGQNILGGLTLRGLIAKDYRPLLVITRPENDYQNLVMEISKHETLPCLVTADINGDHSLIQEIKGLQLDIALCCSWGARIKEQLLSLPRLGWVNFHPSYLPAYRGPRPIEWQLINGEDWGGCTAHFMTSEFDKGPIILQEPLRIALRDNGETLRVKCGEVMGRLAPRCMELLAEQPSFEGVDQDESSASYAPPRENYRTINWKMPAHKINDLVRGLSPFPCAMFHYKGVEIKVAEVAVTNTRCEGIPPGTVKQEGAKLKIATGDYYIEVISLK